MLPLARFVTKTLPAMHPEATTVPLFAKVEIYSLWN